MSFWIRVGDWACAPARRRLSSMPPDVLGPEDVARICNPKLSEPFVPNPPAQEAYREVVRVVEGLDARVSSSEQFRIITEMCIEHPGPEPTRMADWQWSMCRYAANEIDGLLTGDWQYPVVFEEEGEFKELAQLKKLIAAIQTRAAQLWVDGDAEGALAHIKRSFRLAQRIKNCGGLFIHELVGSSCNTRLCRVIRKSARFRPPPDPLLVELDTILATTPDLISHIAELFDREFRFSILPNLCLRGQPNSRTKPRELTSPALVQAHAQEVLVNWTFRSHPSPIDRKIALQDLSRAYDRLSGPLSQGWEVIDALRALSEEYGAGIPKEYRAPLLDPIFGVQPSTVLLASRNFRKTPNAFGRLAMHKVFSISGDLVRSSYKSEAEIRATRIFLAASRFLSSSPGARISHLESLVASGYLTELPSSPVDGEPFQFDEPTQSIWLPGPKSMTFDEANKSRTNGAWIWRLPTTNP